MDLVDSPEEAEFRARVRSWLEVSLPRLPWPQPEDLVQRVPFWREWQKMIFEGGWAGLTWPTEYGGLALSEGMRAIFTEECDLAGAPDRVNLVGEDFAGPPIVHFGTEDQKERYLRPILTGEEIWCQLFSEPGAGSDLASLATKATAVDGGFCVSGQKVWTSRAQVASHAILLARTGGSDPDKARHRGITFFLVPMDSEGITVRPLHHMLGEAEFNEVFLDDVFVPADAVLGSIDGGWQVAMATLAFERVAIATGRVNTTKAVRDIVEHVRSARDGDGVPLGSNAHVRQQVAELWARSIVHRAISLRVVTGADAGGPPGPVTSIGKLYACPLVEDLADFRLSLEPLGGQFGLDDETADADAEHWVRLANQARGTAIGGGSSFIQRNIVSERILHMPRV